MKIIILFPTKLVVKIKSCFELKINIIVILLYILINFNQNYYALLVKQ